MYAIIECCGKQYKVNKGDIIEIDKIEKQVGEKISLTPVLFAESDGASYVGDALQKVKVYGEILGESKGPKILIYKYKKRKNYNKKTGHRQKYIRIKITDIAVA